MRPPCELVIRDFLPAVRASTAKALKDRGLSQSEIAHGLDITQAAVSKYLTQPSSTVEENKAVAVLVKKLTDMIASGSDDSDKTTKALCSTCMYLRLGSTICRNHKESVPRLKLADCRICSELLAGREASLSGRAKVLAGLEVALEEIEACEHFFVVMPQVRANLVACDPDATSDSDVAGVPGRITLVNGRAVAHEGPQFGASRHTAALLLWAKGRWPQTRACLCISGRDDIVQSAKAQGFTLYNTTKPTTDALEIAESAGMVIKRTTKQPSLIAVHVPGGIGVEPILYLFGRSAEELARGCISICEDLYHASSPPS
ncbi:MAG: hypothetical protein C4K47_02150 [Candidatus Thorarchaeota archaeon]|nr:MAG: hypothetical protein C4K47_02150 [Candidatus Thorarchaeota archaeon]